MVVAECLRLRGSRFDSRQTLDSCHVSTLLLLQLSWEYHHGILLDTISSYKTRRVNQTGVWNPSLVNDALPNYRNGILQIGPYLRKSINRLSITEPT